jgi:hypothetical protein
MRLSRGEGRDLKLEDAGFCQFAPQIFSAKVRILPFVRPYWHNWLFRLAALLIFISGGALARAMVQDFEHHFALPVREPAKQDLSAVTLEVRQPTPVQGEGVAVVVVLPLPVQPSSPSLQAWIELRPVLAKARVFDALAPPA